MNEKTDYEVFWEFQKRLIAIYEIEELECIEGDNDFMIDGENVLSSFMTAMLKGQRIYAPENRKEQPKFDYNSLFSDLKLISDEILHFTGLTCLYSKYLSNPLDQPFRMKSGDTVFINNQQLPDKRFFMYASIAYEKLYNYWDRIGDLMASFFPESIKPKRVFFSRINEFIPDELHSAESITWLVNFKNNQFQKLNTRRNGIVHYESLDTTFVSKHLKNPTNRSQIEKLIKNRSKIIPDLKSHIDLSLKGMVQVIRFMEFLNSNVLDEEQIEIKRMAVHNKPLK